MQLKIAKVCLALGVLLMSRKSTIEEMHALAFARGGECLSVRYVDQKTPLKWKCSAAHIWLAKPSDIKGSKNKKGTWCRECGKKLVSINRSHTLQDLQKMALEKNGECSSTSYFGSQIKHLWRCKEFPQHSEFLMLPNAVQQGQWCPKCSGNAKPSFEELNDLAKTKNQHARCLSSEYKNSTTLLNWSCGVVEHPTFQRTYRSVRFDRGWCPLCKKEMSKRRTKYSLELLASFATQAGGKLISKEPYKNTKQRLRWECADGHNFQRSLDQIISANSFCPTCSTHGGLRELYVRELFHHLFQLPFERTRSLAWLRNERGNSMELDGYSELLNLAFEHNGQQHYEIDGFFNRSESQLSRRLNDDAEKARLCIENNVVLIVVPHSIPLVEIQPYVIKNLSQAGIEPVDIEPFSPGVLVSSKLNLLSQHAKHLGGSLISNKYQGSDTKHEWKCASNEHPAFLMTPSAALNRGTWCPLCANDRASASYRLTISKVQELAKANNGELVVAALSKKQADQGLGLSDLVTFRCFVCGHERQRSVRQVKEESLCLCRTKKVRISELSVQEKLVLSGIKLLRPEQFSGGRTQLTLQCKNCSTQWLKKASSVISDGASCPKCRKNSRVDFAKAQELGERIGFSLGKQEVSSGSDVLNWTCVLCGHEIQENYRKMRNVKICPQCDSAEAAKRLSGPRLPGIIRNIL